MSLQSRRSEQRERPKNEQNPDHPHRVRSRRTLWRAALWTLSRPGPPRCAAALFRKKIAALPTNIRRLFCRIAERPQPSIWATRSLPFHGFGVLPEGLSRCAANALVREAAIFPARVSAGSCEFLRKDRCALLNGAP